ncbi:MAG: DUF1329 domain-containing protein [Thermodesulfobacteriota bacterium]|nr:DUF1329 domain-containing protein [Thermodesulfobacteriota bacterium]
MRKHIVMLFIFMAIPVLIWGKGDKIKIGTIITNQNYKQYIPAIKSMLPEGSHYWIINGIKKGWITIPLVQREKNYPAPPGFAAATKKYAGVCKIGQNNELIGHVAGIPFPDPKNGIELAWNCYSEIRRQCIEDDEFSSPFLLIDKNGDLEREFNMLLWKKKWTKRTDIEPIPQIPAGRKGLTSKESFVINEPFDVKGFAQVRIRYEALEKFDEVYSYIPAIRRIRRLTGSDLTDPLLGSDQMMDDFELWRQKITPKMTFKFSGVKEYLVPRTYTKKPPQPFIRHNLFQAEWETRDLYKLEVIMNDPDYAYSRRVIYASPENNTYCLYYGENYDQKGRLWRGDVLLVQATNPAVGARLWYGTLKVDHLTQHSTVMDMYPSLKGMPVSQNNFTIKYLITKAR